MGEGRLGYMVHPPLVQVVTARHSLPTTVTAARVAVAMAMDDSERTGVALRGNTMSCMDQSIRLSLVA